MQKEVLTLEKIASDLNKVSGTTMQKNYEVRFTYIMPITSLAVLIGILLESILIGLLIFSVAAYHIVRCVLEYRDYSSTKKAVRSKMNRGDISICKENFSHFAVETIYEPHVHYHRVGKNDVDMYKHVKFMYFMSGTSWRVPIVKNHYAWSKEYYVSTEGLDNISLQGDEFYYGTLQGDYDISYVYPCKFFTLDSSLKRDEPQ